MNNDILFTETQRFRQWWFWLFLIGINGVFFWGTISQVIGGSKFGDNPMSNGGLIFAAAMMLLVTILFLSFRLETIITSGGIYVRFFPINLKFRFYSWDKIKIAFIKTYHPIKEYGGYGIRFGFTGKGEAINISGNKGLQLQLENNKRILIGTNKPGEMEAILITLGQLKPE